MDYQIITFGNGEILKGVFDSIAMCLNAQTGTLFTPLVRLGLIIGALWMAIYAIYGDQLKAFTGWIFPMTAIMNILFVPQTSVWIMDPVTHYHQKVDHVPYGLAMFAGYVSKIGHGITEQVEKIFSLPDDLKYQKSGSLFASNMIQKAKTFHITNEDLASNMREFVGQCVVYDALLGRKYTLEDLRHSEDIWGLVSLNASPVRAFLWRDLRSEEEKGQTTVITCQEGVKKFNALWGKELDRAGTLFGTKIFGKNGLLNPKTELLKYLPLSYQALTNISASAQDLLRQHMMIYAVVEGIEQKSSALGNVPNFAVKRAYLHQRSTYETLGAMAGETLPTMKAVLEAIAYAMFLFVIPLSLLPFGWKILLAWGQTLLWLQMWPPLYAVLNYIMTMSAKAQSTAALSLSNSSGITIASSVGLSNLNADITAMAGYLAMSIPFLCIALIKGVGSFVHLASHLGNVSQSSAGLASGEVTSGNLSFGNISQGNHQIANTSMLNQSYAASYRSSSFQHSDGRKEFLTSSQGEQITNIGVSHLPISLNVAETQSAQLSQMASQSYQQALQSSQAASESLSSSYRNLMDLSQHLAKSQHLSDQASQGIHTEEAKAIQKAAHMMEDFGTSHHLSQSQTADLFADVGGGVNVGFFKGGLGMKVGAGAQDQKLYQNAKRLAQSEDFQQTMRQAMQSSTTLSHSLSDEASKRLSESVSNSFEAAQSFRTEAMKSLRTSEDLQHQANITQSQASSINTNKTQEFMEWLSQQPADQTSGTLGRGGAAHIIAHQPKLSQAYAQEFIKNQTSRPSLSLFSSESLGRHYEASLPEVSQALMDGSSLSSSFSKGGEESPIDIREGVENINQARSQDLLSQEERFKHRFENAQKTFEQESKKSLPIQALRSGKEMISKEGANIGTTLWDNVSVLWKNNKMEEKNE